MNLGGIWEFIALDTSSLLCLMQALEYVSCQIVTSVTVPMLAAMSSCCDGIDSLCNGGKNDLCLLYVSPGPDALSQPSRGNTPPLLEMDNIKISILIFYASKFSS